MIVEAALTKDDIRGKVAHVEQGHFSVALIVDGADGKPAIEYAAYLLQHDPHLSCVLILFELDSGLLMRALRLHVADVVTQPLKDGTLLNVMERAIAINRHKHMAYLSFVQARDMTKIHRRLMAGREFSFKDFRPDYRKRLENVFFPAYAAGGDFGGCIRMDDHRMLIISGDVSGHDIKSGFISAYFLGLNRGMLMLKAEPEYIFDAFNKFLIDVWNAGCDEDEIATSISVCFILLDFAKKEVSCSCNGLPSPILCDDSMEVTFLGSNGPPLGWFAEPIAPVRTFPMPDCGCIVTFTDGLLDLGTQSLCPLGMADAILGISPESSASNSIFENQSDDVFVQRFAWERIVASESRVIRPLCSDEFHFSDLGGIDTFQERWNTTIRTVLPGLPKVKRREILLCCREAVINAVEHGCRCLGESKCRLTMACYGRNILRVRVKGEAPGEAGSCKCEPYRKPDAHVPFGMKIIHGYADSFVYDEKNNSILLDFNLTSAAITRRYQTDEDNNETLMLLQ